MIRNVGLALLMTLMASASVEAQRNDRGDDGPINALLGMRAELNLTADQVEQLTNLESTLQARNEPLVGELMEIRRSIRALGPRKEFTPEVKASYEALIDRARPLMKQIRENNTSAMRQIGTVLDEAQKQQLSEILRERRNDGRRGDSQRSRRNG